MTSAPINVQTLAQTGRLLGQGSKVQDVNAQSGFGDVLSMASGKSPDQSQPAVQSKKSQSVGNDNVSLDAEQTRDVQKTDNGQERDSSQKTDTESENVRETTGRESQEKETDGDSVKVDNEKADQPVTEPENELAGVPKEQLEQLMETLLSALAGLQQNILQETGITREELQQIMNDLGMTTADLLDPDKLKGLLLQIGGAEDSMALLTDEGLYQTVQSFGDTLEQVTETLTSQFGVTEEEFTTLTEQLKQTMQPEQSQQPEQLQQPEQSSQSQQSEQSQQPEQLQRPEQLQQPERLDRPAEVIRPEERTTEARKETDTQPETPVITPEGSDTGEAEQTMQTGGRTPDRDSEGSRRESGENHHFTPAFVQSQVQPQNTVMSAASEIADRNSMISENTQEIMDQIMEFMRVQLRPETTSLSMQLHPESLGTLQIHISAKEGIMTAQFVASSESVKAALEQQMTVLQDNFQNQNIKVEAIEVTVATHQFESNLEQGRERQSESENEGKKPRTRRLNLNSLDLESTDELTDEERIAAQMMAANGNTVDYMA